MAWERDNLILSFPAAADLSARQFYAVTLNTDGQVTTAGGTASSFIGVLQDDPDAAGLAASVMIEGVSKLVVYGGSTAIAVWDALTTDANGIGIKTTTDNAGIIGRALEAASDGENVIISVLLRPGRY